MKKIFLLITFSIAALSAWAYDFQSGDLYYNITSHTAPYTVEVTYKKFSSTGNYTGMTDIIIPESVTHNNITYSVTKIGEAAFYGCSSLISVHIPNTITTIDAMAFCDCSSLATLNIPSSVVKIGIGALENTELYNDQEHWSGGALYIDNCLIKADYYITDHYTIQEGTRLVADDAFSSCDSMTSITIPQSVKHLGAYIFEYCESLTSIVIPNSVLSIGAAACSNCPALTSIIVEDGNAKYDSRNNCNAIIETETNTLISGCTTTLIPQSVAHLGEWAFWGCEFESFSIPSSIKSIGEEAFGNCQNLERLTCEASVLPEMGVDVFDQESDLLGLYYSTPICHATLYVPAEALEKYKTAEQWKEFGTILPLGSYNPDPFPTLAGLQRTHTTEMYSGSPVFYKTYSRFAELTQALKDTVIQDHSYLKFYEYYSSLFLREENNKVLIYSTVLQKDLVLYDYTLEVGDSLPGLYIDYSYSEDEPFAIVDYNIKRDGSRYFQTDTFVVTDVSHVTLLDGIERKKWTLTNKHYGVREYVEGIGSFGEGYNEAGEFFFLILNHPYTTESVGVHLVCVSKDGQLLYQMDAAEMERLRTECLCDGGISSAVEAITTPDSDTKKFLHNNQLFILRDGKTYNVMGIEIK